MRKLTHLLFSFALLPALAPGEIPLPQSFATMPQAFEPNRGQATPGVDFTSHGPGYTLSLSSRSALLELFATNTRAREEKSAAVRLRLVGSDTGSRGEGVGRQTGTSNYLVGNDANRWLTGVPQFGRVEYHGVYPGIDVAYYGNSQRLEYDFILQAHANPARIRLAVDGVDRIRIDREGDLVLSIGSSEIRERKPAIYQETADGRRFIKGRYRILQGNQIGFELEHYDSNSPLVIDPIIVFSTYFGGNGADLSSSVALDTSGNVYIAGKTGSSNLAGTYVGSPTFTSSSSAAAFVAKISPSGAFVFTTIIAGANDAAQATHVVPDANGNIYVGGLTSSASFPTKNAIQSAYGGNVDAFVLELNSSGTGLIFSTYLGGNGLDYAVGLTLDSNGNIFLTGSTASTNFPVLKATQPQQGGSGNGFATKIAAGGGSLVYSTYYGGSGTDYVNGSTIDGSGNLIVYGDTNSTNFPVMNPYQGTFCGLTTGQTVTSRHGWLAKLNSAGVPVYSTYICGSASNDAVRGAAVDSAGNVIITGQTQSTTFPILNPLQAQYGGGADDVFLTQFSPAGTLMYSTYLGGSGDDIARGVVLDQLGNIYVAGQTTSTNFPTLNPTQSKNGGGEDAFLTKFNAGAAAIVFSTYLGGSSNDVANGVAVNGLGVAYLTGATSSSNFPTVVPLQATYGGGSSNGFLTAISTCDISVTASSSTALGSGGGPGSTAIQTSPECGWTAVSNSSWITISSGASGSGAGTVSWTAAQNSCFARTGTMTIAGQTVIITEQGVGTPPTFSISGSGTPPEIPIGGSVTETFTTTGGCTPYTPWSAGNLPGGVTLNAQTGVLSGTPLQPGNYTLTVMLSDSNVPPTTATLPVTLKVLGITSQASLPSAFAGQAYSQTFAAVGGSGTYTFSPSNAPPGLTFSGSVLSGTPSTAGTYNFQVQVADGSGVTTSSSFSLVVKPGLAITSSGNLGEISLGSHVTGTLAATGGKPPYSWSSSSLPAGVTLNATSGALGGIPSQPGNYSFSTQASDAETPAATNTLTLTLQVLGLTTPSALPPASTTAPYLLKFSAAGGNAPYTFASGNLPPGLSFNGATLSGTPTTVGSYSFTVQVADSSGFSASSAYSLVVTGPATPLTISGGTLANGAVGTAYSQALTGTGGAPPYTWTITGGALPQGLSLTGPGGVISGTPTTPGTSVFTAQATDASNASSSGAFIITVAPAALSVSGAPFPNGIAGSDYPLQILTGSGGIGPYTFAIGSGSLPAGLSLASGQIGGIPTASGTSSFTLTMTDSETPAQTITLPAQIVVSPAGSANPILSAGSLSFNLAAGATGLPAPASVTVESSMAQQPLSYSVALMPAVSWLDITGGGTTPGSIGVALDPSAINLGTSSTPLTTGIVVTCLAPSPCAGLSQTIAVSLSVSAPAPLLTFATNLVKFSAMTSSSATLSQQVAIQNVGGGAAVVSSVSAADPWLTVTGAPASVAAGPPVELTFTVNPTGLGPGFFRTTVTIQSSAGTISVPVTLNIAQIPAITLSSAGAQFLSTLGSAPVNTSGSFQVAVSGGPTVNWKASVQPGASWLQLNENTTSGTVNSSSPATVSYRVSPAALTSAQAYYGTIQITANGVTDSPQSYLVAVNVAPTAALPVPIPAPAGLLFQSIAGAGAPPSQTVTVYSSSGTGVNYSASTATTDGNAWLTVSPGTGTSSTSSSAAVTTVSVNPGALPAGVYTGMVSYQYSAAAVRSVNVTMIIVPASGCTPTQLAPTQTGLLNNFAQPVAWPTALSISVVNNCGSSVRNGQVVTTFSNGDPQLTLNLANAGTALYAGTWTPRASSGQVTVVTTVTAPGYNPAVSTITGEVVANAAPLLASGGTLNVFNPMVGGAIGQGAILQIYGSNLSTSPPMQATTVPLPKTLGGTSVTIGGIPAPLYYVSAGQINAQMPQELSSGGSYQVMVNANGALSVPDSIQVTTATPGVAAFPSGQIVAQHPNLALVSETSPAAPGEYIVIYLSGLGLTNPAIADGAAAPNSPFSIPTATPTLTLNGVNVPIYFFGLTPSAVGLFQIDFQVPKNTPNGDLRLVVSQGSDSSNATILPVHN